ncbi:hypothetical protein B566_EDAN006179 [Ephemera danica]|nr:hypothetical protein B566_EDAN006179 [Ephemera danica]
MIRDYIGNMTGLRTTVLAKDTLDLQTLSNGKRYLVSNNEASSMGRRNDILQVIWIGFGMRDWFWTGGHRIGRASWGWLTSATMPFTSWAPSQPNDTMSYGTLECMFTRQGLWYPELCQIGYSWFYEYGGFVCEEN